MTQKHEGAALADVIAFADYSNHAILMWNEFANGMPKLLASDLITVDNKKIKTTVAFTQWWDMKFKKLKRIDNQKSLNDVFEFLSDKKSTFDNSFNFEFTEDEFKKAVNEYLNE